MSTVQSDLSGALQEHWEGVVSQLHADLRRIASREECEDAVQDAIAAALERNDERPLHNPGGWLLLVGRRRALDAWRRRTGRHKDGAQRRRTEPIDGPAARDLGALDADLLALLDAPGSEATETFGALADEHRRILSLRLEGMSVREITQAIGASSEKAAERRLARAWEALRRLFIATERDPDCGAVRTGLAVLHARRRGRRDAASAAAIDYQRLATHLELCPHCRAFEKRAKGILITSPAPTVPAWQQLAQRLSDLLGGPATSRGAEAAAGTLAGGGGAKLVAVLCTGAIATGGVCASLIAQRTGDRSPRDASAPPPTRVAIRDEPARVQITQASASAKARASHTTTTTSSAAQARRDTRQAEQAQPASAPRGSDQTSELLPTGSAGSDARTPAAPAPRSGGGEFMP